MNIITITFDSVGKATVSSTTNLQQGNNLVDQFKFVFDSAWGTITQVRVHALLPDEVTVTPNTVLTESSVGGAYWYYDVPSWFTTYAGQLNLAVSASYALVGDETPQRFSRIIPLQIDKSVISEGTFEIDPIVEDSLLTSIADLTARMIVVENDYVKKSATTLQEIAGPLGVPQLQVDGKYIDWNTDEGTFDVEMLNGAVLQLGQEFYFYGKATEAIAEGSPVQFAGAQGGHIKLKNAVASEINAHPEYMIGIATTTFSGNGVYGYVTIIGKVKGLNTNAYNEGDVLWFDSTSGGLTTTKPLAPNAKIEMCAVLRKHGTQGSIMVRVSGAMKLGDLQDVNVNGEPNGSVLERVDGVWQGTTRLTTLETTVAGLDSTALEGRLSDVEDAVDAIELDYVKHLEEDLELVGSNSIALTSMYATTFNSLDGDETHNVNGEHIVNATGAVVNAETITLNGEIHLNGDVIQNGESYETHAEQVYTTKDHIILRDGAVGGISSGQYAGLITKLADGTNDAFFGYNGDGIARVGDITYDLGVPNFTNTQALATRQDSPTANGVAYFNNTDKRFDTNSTVLINPAAIGNTPLTVNALTGQTADLFKAQLNGSDRFTVGQNGNVYSNGYYLTNNGLINAGGINNSHVNVSSDGVIIYRNVNNSQPALKINSAQGTGNVVNFLKNGSTVGQITQYGQYQGASFGNLSNLNYSFYSPGNTGSIIQRNINDANPALTVNQQQGTGDILKLQFDGVNKSSFDKDGKLTAPALNIATGGTLLASGSGNGSYAVTDLRTYKYIELRGGVEGLTSTKIPSASLVYNSVGITVLTTFYTGSSPGSYVLIPVRATATNSTYTTVEIFSDITDYDQSWAIYGWNY